MTSVSESLSDSALPESVRDLVRPIDDTTNLGGALRVAGDGAVALAQGSAAAGLVVARKGVEASKELAARARRAREEASPLIKAATEKALADKSTVKKADPKSRGGRKALLITGVLGAVVLGGVAFYRSRRPSFPPVAAEPPRLQPVVADNEPTGN
ncbi:hypothetical protein [Rhodococcus artemisiae]|uniref:Cell wall synthesis protein CwsA n=1 Tax=Rhodococcus artemisiae TaxID=714159 RepID=A0ABU7L8S6_9NOCA|nr:hypothetical protein [Rhodococcus artemisiae]MEE2057938.1 hypothetical protein [Rhodococcus artemisiae]